MDGASQLLTARTIPLGCRNAEERRGAGAEATAEFRLNVLSRNPLWSGVFIVFHG